MGAPSMTGGDASLFFEFENEQFDLAVNSWTIKPTYTDRTSKHNGERGERQDQKIMSYEIAGEIEVYSEAEMRVVRAFQRAELAGTAPRGTFVEDTTTPDGLTEQDTYGQCRVQWDKNAPGQDQTYMVNFRAFCNAADVELGTPT